MYANTGNPLADVRGSWRVALIALIAVAGVPPDVRADIPPLTEAQSIELESADDDADVQETAFRVENARQWTEPVGDVAIRLSPDYEQLLQDPAAARGAVCRIEGVLQQHTPMDEPFGDVEEWFVRTDDGRPVQVFVIDPKQARPGITFDDGTRVVVLGRFYKRTEDVDRQGRTQQYPAFVGALPRLATEGSWAAATTPFWIIFVLIALLLGGFGALMVYVRRTKRRVPQPTGAQPQESAMDDPRPLPEDPAEALAELRRRANADA